MKRATIRSGCFAHVRDEQGTKRAGKTPGRQHQAVDGTDILRPKIISGKRRHGAKPAAVTHQHHECNDRHQRGRHDVGEEPEQQNLANEHHEKCCAPRDQIGNPRPKDSPDRVANTGQSDHARSDYRCYSGQLLKKRCLLRDD